MDRELSVRHEQQSFYRLLKELYKEFEPLPFLAAKTMHSKLLEACEETKVKWGGEENWNKFGGGEMMVAALNLWLSSMDPAFGRRDREDCKHDSLMLASKFDVYRDQFNAWCDDISKKGKQ